MRGWSIFSMASRMSKFFFCHESVKVGDEGFGVVAEDEGVVGAEGGGR